MNTDIRLLAASRLSAPLVYLLSATEEPQNYSDKITNTIRRPITAERITACNSYDFDRHERKTKRNQPFYRGLRKYRK